MLSVKLEKKTGTSDPHGWSQVFDFQNELYIIVSANFPYPEIAARINEEYFGKSDLKPFNALRSAIEKATKEVPSDKIHIQVGAIVFNDGAIYASAVGGAQVLIYRDGSLATIIDSKVSEVASASGIPKMGDKIIVGTKNFFENYSQNNLKETITSSGIEDMELSDGTVGVAICNFIEEERVVSTTPPISEAPQPLPKKFNISEFVSSITKKASKLIPERKLYIPKPPEEEVEESKKKKTTLSIGIILLAILVISIVFGIRQKGINAQKAKYEGSLIEAQGKISEAVSIYQTSPDKAKELFAESQRLLDQVISLGVKDKRIDELKDKLDSERGSILGEYTTPPELFLDLTLLSSGFNGDDLATSQGSLFILDRSGKKVVKVDTSNKKSAVVAGPDKVDQALGVAAYSDRVFVLNDLGVKEATGGDTSEIIDKTWLGEALIYAYTGNIYVLDKNAGKIYRYAGLGDNTFGSSQDWLSEDTTVDFKGAKSWVIDGTIYVLTTSGKIAKFSQGSPQNFTITGVYPELTSIDAVYTNEDNQNVYILDANGGRVVALDKTGKYVAQYRNDEIKNSKGLVVSEADKKIILLTGDKLLSIEVRHL